MIPTIFSYRLFLAFGARSRIGLMTQANLILLKFNDSPEIIRERAMKKEKGNNWKIQ